MIPFFQKKFPQLKDALWAHQNHQSIPKNVRPKKDQPFYHLLAENDEITYEAYVSEQNLLMDDSDEPIKHPLIEEIFSGKKGSSYFKLSN